MTLENSELAPALNLQRCYLKALSVELPHAPKIFLEQGVLAMDLAVTLAKVALGEGLIEIVVRGTLTARLGDRIAYLIEAEQAGIFELVNIPLEHVDSIANITAPNIVYPYMRAQMADTIARTGLPVFHLPDVDWVALFAQPPAAAAPAGNPVTG